MALVLLVVLGVGTYYLFDNLKYGEGGSIADYIRLFWGGKII